MTFFIVILTAFLTYFFTIYSKKIEKKRKIYLKVFTKIYQICFEIRILLITEGINNIQSQLQKTLIFFNNYNSKHYPKILFLKDEKFLKIIDSINQIFDLLKNNDFLKSKILIDNDLLNEYNKLHKLIHRNYDGIFSQFFHKSNFYLI